MTNELSPWFQKILQCLLSFGLCMKNDGDVNSRLIDTGDGQFLSSSAQPTKICKIYGSL